MAIYLSTAYLAPIEYFSKIISNEEIYIEKYENYNKQTYRNRCSILSANGIMPLSVPVEHPKSEKVLTKDIRIAPHGNWQHIHWNAIVSAYNSTPYFEYYQDYFYPFYHNSYKFLFDFNEELRVMICDLLNIDCSNITYTEKYDKELSARDKDYRETIHPKKDRKIYDPDFIAQPYYQVFSERFGFIPNLSIIDLVFNMGNESIIILTK